MIWWLILAAAFAVLAWAVWLYPWLGVVLAVAAPVTLVIVSRVFAYMRARRREAGQDWMLGGK